MEKSKYILGALVAMMPSLAFSQNNAEIYQAYIEGDMSQWKRSIDTFVAKSDAEVMELINYEYGYIGWALSQKKKREAKEYLKRAESNLEKVEKSAYEMSTVYAYKAAFVGFKIGLSPYKAPFIGQKSVSSAQKSLELDSANYISHIQLGNIAFYTPKLFGGSKPKAIEHYLRALEILESDKALLVNNWNYLNLLAIIIDAYYQMEEYAEAKKFCIKTLDIEPDFNWVKDELYPKIIKKLSL